MNELTAFWLRQLGFLKKEGHEGHTKLMHYKKGETIYRQGSALTGVYFIKSGMMKCLLDAGDGVNRIIGIRGKDDFIAYKDAILGNRQNSNTVQTLEPVTVIFIPYLLFMDTLADYPRMARTFFRLLSQDLIEAENNIVGFARKPVSGRVAYALLWLDNYFQGGSIPLSRTEFGNMIGTATETAIRVLSVFKAKKLISINKRTTIRVINRKKLQKQL